MKKKQPLLKPNECKSTSFAALRGLSVKATSASSGAIAASPRILQPTPTMDEDDLDLFFRAVSDVRPLIVTSCGAPSSPVTPSPATRLRKHEENDRKLFMEALEGMAVRFEDEIPDEDDSYPPHASPRLKQLRQGTIKIRMELDLHGLTRDEALKYLARFIDGAWQREMKAVLVITGKGNNSPGEPILQEAVAGWFRDQGKKRVVEFAPAPSRMGGAGAFVVFLRPR